MGISTGCFLMRSWRYFTAASSCATFQGKDAQLEAAVKYLQDLIKKQPVEIPKHPPYPDKRK